MKRDNIHRQGHSYAAGMMEADVSYISKLGCEFLTGGISL